MTDELKTTPDSRAKIQERSESFEKRKSAPYLKEWEAYNNLHTNAPTDIANSLHDLELMLDFKESIEIQLGAWGWDKGKTVLQSLQDGVREVRAEKIAALAQIYGPEGYIRQTAKLGVEIVQLKRKFEAAKLENEWFLSEINRVEAENRRLQEELKKTDNALGEAMTENDDAGMEDVRIREENAQLRKTLIALKHTPIDLLNRDLPPAEEDCWCSGIDGHSLPCQQAQAIFNPPEPSKADNSEPDRPKCPKASDGVHSWIRPLARTFCKLCDIGHDDWWHEESNEPADLKLDPEKQDAMACGKSLSEQHEWIGTTNLVEQFKSCRWCMARKYPSQLENSAPEKDKND